MIGMFPSPQPVKINGHDFLLSALTFGDVANFCQWVRVRRINEMLLAKGYEPGAAPLEEFNAVANAVQGTRFFDTTCTAAWNCEEGAQRLVWLSARHASPDMTFADFVERTSSITKREVRTAMVLVFRVTSFLKEYVSEEKDEKAPDNGTVGGGDAQEAAG